MKKQLFFLAVAALALASCSSENLSQEKSALQNSEPGTVMFDAYTQRTTTRAGSVEIMKDATLRNCGFGVFGFYTNNSDYDPQSIPNFFYNQKVEWNGTNWAYDPVKYWPNEYGENAESDDFDRVSYFAYAPYVKSVPSTGKIVKDPSSSDEDKWGITGMTRNSATGDPIIKYIASFDQSKAVDLIWGVCDNPLWSIVQDGSKQKINDAEMGLPWLNVYRPMETDNQRVKFTFKHALSQLSVNVDAFVDGYNNSNALKADETRIFIRSISFTGFAMKGALNLNNTEKNKAYWLDYTGTADLETGEVVTIYDGRKDGKEGATGSIATNEKMLGLNPQFVQDVEWYSAPTVVNSEMAAGVTNVPATLFRKFNGTEYVPADQPALVIPTGEPMEVEIVYDIETVDKNLSTYVSDGNTQGSSIENRIKKSINFGGNGLENGKHYTLNLHLGLNSVKFDAEVSDWVDAAVTPDADLPSNMPTMNADVNSKNPHNDVDVDWNYATSGAETKYYFYAIDGFNGGEAVSKGTPSGCTAEINSKPDFTGTANQANASGVAYVKVQITAPNDGVLKQTNAASVTVTGGVSTKEHTLNISQLARPLSMRVREIDGTGKVITLERWDGTAQIVPSEEQWEKSSTGGSDDYLFIVLKNGVKMEKGTGEGKYQIGTKAPGAMNFTLGTAAVAGDIYTITVKTGDAAEETVVAKIGGISYAPGTREITYHAADPGDQDVVLPTLSGPGTNAATFYSWTPISGSYITVSDDGKIFTKKSTDGVTVTATLKSDYIDDAKTEGWFFTTANSTANYTLKVNKQATKGEFVAPSINKKHYDLSDVILNATGLATAFTFKGAEEDPAPTADGNVYYTIDEVKKGDDILSVSDIIEINSSKDLSVKSTSGLAAGIYHVTITAIMNANAKFNGTSKQGTITFEAE